VSKMHLVPGANLRTVELNLFYMDWFYFSYVHFPNWNWNSLEAEYHYYIRLCQCLGLVSGLLDDFKNCNVHLGELSALFSLELLNCPINVAWINCAEKEVPTKCIRSYQKFPVRARILYIDFEGRSDGESVRKIITQLKPRQLVSNK